MSEFQIMVELNSGSIVMNTDELKKKLSEKMAEYKNIVFTEESKSIAKSELASLRRLKKDVDERRKVIKAQWNAPLEVFEKEVKQLQLIIDEPINEIDTQLKEMEAERIRKKREAIHALYIEVVAEASEYLPFNEIYDSKWDNAGTNMKKIREAMEQLVTKAANDIAIIQNSLSDVKDEAISIYKINRDLGAALTHINAYEANKKKVLEAENARREREEVRRREEEIARARANERAHLEELNKVKTEKQECPDYIPIAPPEFDEDDSLPFVQPTTKTVFYKVVATPEELEQVEMAFNSIGIYFERREQ